MLRRQIERWRWRCRVLCKLAMCDKRSKRLRWLRNVQCQRSSVSGTRDSVGSVAYCVYVRCAAGRTADGALAA